MRPWLATLFAPAVLALTGCGSGRTATSVPTPAPAPRGARQPPVAGDEVLAVGSLGRLTGRCPPGARRWALRYLAAAGTATEAVTWQVGGGPRRTASADPGASVAIELPAGRGGAFGGFAPPLRLSVTQATEAQTLGARAELRLRGGAGGSIRCAADGAVALSARSNQG